MGGTRPIKLDIRLITATNVDLNEASRNGKFRQDLYYRLNVVSIKIPPLRERTDDIPMLAAFFTARYSERVKRPVAGISPKARVCLLRYPWPGNVRELENAIERAVVLGSTELILPEDLPDSILEETASSSGEPITALHDGIREAKKTHRAGDRTSRRQLYGRGWHPRRSSEPSVSAHTDIESHAEAPAAGINRLPQWSAWRPRPAAASISLAARGQTAFMDS